MSPAKCHGGVAVHTRILPPGGESMLRSFDAVVGLHMSPQRHVELDGISDKNHRIACENMQGAKLVSCLLTQSPRDTLPIFCLIRLNLQRLLSHPRQGRQKIREARSHLRRELLL